MNRPDTFRGTVPHRDPQRDQASGARASPASACEPPVRHRTGASRSRSASVWASHDSACGSSAPATFMVRYAPEPSGARRQARERRSGPGCLCRPCRSPAHRPVLNLETVHRKVTGIAGCETRLDTKRRRCDEAVSLMERDASGGELTPPSTRRLPLPTAERRHAQAAEELDHRGILVRVRTAPDFVDVDRTHERHLAPSP